VTYTTSTTFPNGGPTQTYLTASTFYNNNGGFGLGNGAFTSTFLTTTTYPNGGPTQTYFTTSTAFGQFNGFGDQYPSGLIFSTGFIGLRTTTSTGQHTFSTATTDNNGNVRSFRTQSLSTATLTVSGVSRVTRTTFQTTATITQTGTQFINGQLIASTTTFTSQGLTTATRPDYNFNNAAGKHGVAESIVEKAVLALVGAAWYFI
jgi:hypothetical protein